MTRRIHPAAALLAGGYLVLVLAGAFCLSRMPEHGSMAHHHKAGHPGSALCAWACQVGGIAALPSDRPSFASIDGTAPVDLVLASLPSSSLGSPFSARGPPSS